jgi:pilus assembly protein CpaD
MTKEAVMTRPTKILRVSAALAALLVTACAYPVNGPEDAPPVTERFPITVEPHMEALDVAYDVQRNTLDDAGSAELARFVRDYLENGSGAISVSATRRTPNAAITVAGRLAALGVPRDRIMIGSDDALRAGDEVKLTYIRYQAHTEACGDWSVNLGYTSANKPSPNFGCATQHNLAAMVADPRDLVSPKTLEPDDAQRRLTVLDKYRKGDTTVATKTDEQKGTVSTVAGGK